MSKITDAMVQALKTEFASLEMDDEYARGLLGYYENEDDPYKKAKDYIEHGEDLPNTQNQQTVEDQDKTKDQPKQTVEDQDKTKDQNQPKQIDEDKDKTKGQDQTKDQDQKIDDGLRGCFEIIVRSMDLRNKFSLIVRSTDTFGIVKIKIQGKLGYSPDTLHIIHRSKIVRENNHTLEEHRISSNASIFLVIVNPAQSDDSSVGGFNGFLWKGPTGQLFADYGPPADALSPEYIQSAGESLKGSGGFPSGVVQFSPSLTTITNAVGSAVAQTSLQAPKEQSGSTSSPAAGDGTGTGPKFTVSSGSVAGGAHVFQGGFVPEAFELNTTEGQNRCFNDMCPTCARSCNAAVLLNGAQQIRRVDCGHCNKSFLLNPRVCQFQEVGYLSEALPQ